jgi:hypothetical protein
MKIYADWYSRTFIKPQSCILFQDINIIPHGVDVIAFSRNHSKLDEIQLIINQLLPKTNKLYVILIEATNPKLVDFLLENNNSKIEFFVDAVINCPIANVKSISSWFMTPHNLYSTSPAVKALLTQLTRPEHKPKFFDCLLGMHRDHRDQITRFYKNSTHKDKFIFTYFKDNLHNGLWDIDIDSNITKTHQQIILNNSGVPVSAILPITIYNESYYSVVAETTCYNDYNQYTEKVAKPLLAKRLFVVFAGQYYLRNLRDKGFMTFGTVIDERYDSIEDPDIRFFQAWQQIEYLCSQNPKEILDRVDYILEYNQRHFLNTDWHHEMRLTFGIY